MRTLFSIVLFLYFSCICNIESALGETPDSVAMFSRIKADKVLSYFDTIAAPKVLYSIDKHFFVIIEDSPSYKEYYIVLDDRDEIKSIRSAKASTKTRKQRKQNKIYQKRLSEAEPVFDLSRYHADFITKMPDAPYWGGKYSYFVIKDIDGKRYGEFRLPVVTPCPIDNEALWIYVVIRLIGEMTK